LTFLPNATCDPAGEGAVFVSIPAGATGVNVWFQSLDVSSSTLTNGVAATVQ
ncbi:MAG: hypothetical protein ISR76_07850, partial [Planctomycetes bacterium]|nr:hypothetical protein [Planctomycetota bacterium]